MKLGRHCIQFYANPISTFALTALSIVLSFFFFLLFFFRSKGDPSDPLNSSRSSVGPSKHLSLPNVSLPVTEEIASILTLLYFGHNWML